MSDDYIETEEERLAAERVMAEVGSVVRPAASLPGAVRRHREGPA